MAQEMLKDWGGDVLGLNAVSEGHALYFLALAVLNAHGLVQSCNIDLLKLRNFLLRIEAGYGNNPYHNSCHAGDVMLNVHLFVSKNGITARLRKEELLAILVGALIHDFNHTGTSNAHEVMANTPLAQVRPKHMPSSGGGRVQRGAPGRDARGIGEEGMRR